MGCIGYHPAPFSPNTLPVTTRAASPTRLPPQRAHHTAMPPSRSFGGTCEGISGSERSRLQPPPQICSPQVTTAGPGLQRHLDQPVKQGDVAVEGADFVASIGRHQTRLELQELRAMLDQVSDVGGYRSPITASSSPSLHQFCHATPSIRQCPAAPAPAPS